MLKPGARPSSGTRYRALRAIFAADIAGFSRAMSINETSAAASLTQIRMLALQRLDAHNGWLFGMPGDGIFAIFESAIEAVRCAVELQEAHASHPQLAHMKLRIGVHLGEVLFENDWPYGIALAIAARLEALADPGGILVSSTVKDAVSARLDVAFEERGPTELKNIPQRMVTFAVVAGPRADQASAATTDELPNLDRTTRLSGDVLSEFRRRRADFLPDPEPEAPATATGNAQEEAAAASVASMAPEGATAGDLADGARGQTAPTTASSQEAQPAIHASHASPPELPVTTDDRALAGHLHEQHTPTTAAGGPPDDARATLAGDAEGQVRRVAGPSEACIQELTAALAIHLGPVARLIVNRCRNDISSSYDLANRLEDYIPSEDERLLFRLRASHICRSTP